LKYHTINIKSKKKTVIYTIKIGEINLYFEKILNNKIIENAKRVS